MRTRDIYCDRCGRGLRWGGEQRRWLDSSSYIPAQCSNLPNDFHIAVSRGWDDLPLPPPPDWAVEA